MTKVIVVIFLSLLYSQQPQLTNPALGRRAEYLTAQVKSLFVMTAQLVNRRKYAARIN